MNFWSIINRLMRPKNRAKDLRLTLVTFWKLLCLLKKTLSIKEIHEFLPTEWELIFEKKSQNFLGVPSFTDYFMRLCDAFEGHGYSSSLFSASILVPMIHSTELRLIVWGDRQPMLRMITNGLKDLILPFQGRNSCHQGTRF